LEERREEGRPRFGIEAFAQQVFPADSKPFQDLTGRGYFTVADVPFNELIPQWFDLYERVERAIQMLSGLHYLDAGYINTRVMIACVSLESLHSHLDRRKLMPKKDFRKFERQARSGVEDRFLPHLHLHNSLTFDMRISELSRRPDQEAVSQLLGDVAKWRWLAKTVRNGFAHGSRTSDRIPMDLQYRLMVVTRALCDLVLGQELRVPAERQRRYVQLREVGFNSLEFKRMIDEFEFPTDVANPLGGVGAGGAPATLRARVKSWVWSALGRKI
jgi:hypothetical protein